jgi:1-acyl-sn-glycerol-3-phosphate acyltransferase
MKPWVRLLFWPLWWLLLQTQLLILGVGSVVWNLLALPLVPLARLLPGLQGTRLGRATIALGYRSYWAITTRIGMLRIDARALDVLRDEQGLVIVANHPSMLDAPMLMSRLPRSFCIMKASLLHNPLLGPAARLARYIGNATAYGMVVDAVAELQSGGQLVLFPEGTRTLFDAKQPLPYTKLHPFHASFALIAQRAQAPVQTVFIDSVSPYLGKGWPLWRLPPLPACFTVRVGQRFEPGQDPKALLAEVENYFVQDMQQRAAAGHS